MDEKEEDKKVEEAKVDESTQVQGRQAESQAKIYKIDMDHASKVLSMQEDELAEVQEVVDVVTTAKLIIEFVTAASETVTAASVIISAAEPQVPVATITPALEKVDVAPSRRQKGVVIRDPEEELTTSSIISTETKSKDKGKGIMVEEPKPLKKKQQIEMDEEYARKLHVEINKDIDWDLAIDHVKLKAKEDPASINETPAQKAAKRRLNEEVEDLKRHPEIVPNEDDDVYTEATPLARKVPVVDYEIIELNNKPYYKIIRADGTHQLCTCSSLEKSKDYTWSSKGQELEATRIMWCAYYNLYNHVADFVKRKKCCQEKLMMLDNATEERLMLLSHIIAAKVKLMLSRQS
nr:hypothetical protein [Tanacetum cinerariifolium]